MTVQIIEFNAEQQARIDELAEEYRARVEGRIPLAKRIDDNQPAIVAALRQIGASVQVLSEVGKGCPDIAVGFRGRNIFMEIKDGAKAPSKRRLTPDEQAWHDNWRGTVIVVENIKEAIYAVMETDL